MKKTLLCVLACLCLFTKIYAQAPPPITTTIRASQCGTTLPALNTLISAVCTPQATAYRFEITDPTTNTSQIIERNVNYFSLTMLPFYDYESTYGVRVELQISGVWQGSFGSSCPVSSPSVLGENGAAQLTASQCGMQLSSINQLISTNSLAGVTGYRFRITDEANPDPAIAVQIIDRQQQWFSLTMLDHYNYGAYYHVEVAIKTTGDYTGYGQPCVISAPDVPTLNSCGQTIENSASPIATLSLSKVVSYRFEVTDLSTLIATTIDRPTQWFTFDQIPDYNPGTSYGVRISLLTSGTYSVFGEACEIFSPQNSRLSLTKREIPKNPSMQAFPNPFTESFRINSDLPTVYDIDIKAFDMTGRLLDSLHIHPGELDYIDLGKHFPSGVYNITISAGEQNRTLRVIKR